MSGPEDDMEHVSYVANSEADLDDAIDQLERMVDEHEEDSETRATLLFFLAQHYFQRYAQEGERSDLDDAVDALKEADEISTDETNRAARSGMLGRLLHHRFTKYEELSDLDDAVDALKVAIDLHTDQPSRASYLESLGQALRDKYNNSGERSHLEEGIQSSREAVQISLDDHPERCIFLNSLGIMLAQKYEWTGDTEDINEAIRKGLQAVLAAPDVSKRATCLNTVGHQLKERYFRSGDINDLDGAVECAREALGITPESEVVDRGLYYNLLCGSLRERHARVGALADLDEAINAGRQAEALIPATHMDRPKVLHNLGMTIHQRYARTESIGDLDEAIQLVTAAVNTPEQHTGQSPFLNSLASYLGDRYADRGETADLRQAIDAMRLAIEKAPGNHADKGIWLSNLGTLLDPTYTFSWAKGAAVDGLTSLDEAIDVTRQAIETTPPAHPTRGTFTYSLGRRLVRKLRAGNGDADCLSEAISRLDYVLEDPKTPTLMRILAGKSILEESLDWQEAHHGASRAVQLVPTLTSKSLGNADRQQLLGQLTGLASDAAATALYEERGPLAAIELLEQGRGVLAASLNEMRADALDLQKAHPQRSERFEQLRDLLSQPVDAAEGPFMGKKTSLSSQAPTDQRYNAGKELETLLREIRGLPGFENFLGPPTELEMIDAASHGPIVVINVSEFRCDALLVTKDGVRTLELERLSLYTIEEYARQDALHPPRRILGSPPVLEWLWDVIASPILEALGFRETPLRERCLATWYHMRRSSETVLDRVISSYSSSIRAIIDSRRQPAAASETVQALLVAMEYTREWGPPCLQLPKSLCESKNIHTVEPICRKEEVMSELPRCAIFHFAGHGYTDAVDPSKSYLCLEDVKEDPLRVEALLDMNLRRHSPFLAYLSACGTGRLEVMKFMDENIHLISAFQLAGFRHVIGTLWNVDDDVCVDIARITYEEIGKSKGLEDEAVYRGLHKAIRDQRDQWLTDAKAKGAKREFTGLSREWTEDTSQMEGCLIGKDEQQEAPIRKALCRWKPRAQREDRLSRIGIMFEADDGSDQPGLPPLHWVPYVHYGP
ncbi:CHAT domain-containing protein [Apiospora hydei]|uniref:CHAT domain-containing protein n=1 Tax=Apiospora hydei TaxID=1337664 RepID=A0ABR1X9L7_9PEZI